MSTLTLEIITQEKHVLTRTVSGVVAPAINGEVTILANHIPLFTRLNDGIVKLLEKNGSDEFAILGGFMDVGPNNHVTIMADAAVNPEEVNEARAQEAMQRAQKTLEETESDQVSRQAQQDLRRAMLELQVARRKRNKRTE